MAKTPLVLIIEERSEHISLSRYTSDGRCVGDSWHQTIDGARQQAVLEFGDMLIDWALVPLDVNDAVLYEVANRQANRDSSQG